MNNNYDEIKDSIRNTLRIEDIIGRQTRLRPTSRGYMGLCPFHDEHTPSFHVYTDTQSYHCFSCQASGDIFTYVMAKENMTFPEAMRYLADMAGIKLPEYSGHTQPKRDILTMAYDYYHGYLKSSAGSPARDYMTSRGLDAHDIETFSLGYAPQSWDALTRYMTSRGVTHNELISSGLVIQGNRGPYDRFRGRLMFGIRDITGRIIAFGGRLIDGEGAKYINSPESNIYHKRSNLYLLDKARKFIREKNRSILVEGYMDALRLHKCGYSEAVASLGTSLTDEQAELLSRFGDKCYICYDSDSAGQNATLKGMYILASHGLDVHVVSIPEGKDPDEYLCAHESFDEPLRQAKPLISHHLSMIVPKMTEPAGRRKMLQDFFAQISSLGRIAILDHKAEICDALNIRPMDLDSWLDRKTQDIPAQASKPEPKPELEGALCALLYHEPELRREISLTDIVSVMSTDLAQRVAMAVIIGDSEALYADNGAGIGLIARGEELCAQIRGNVREKWQKLLSSQKWHVLNRRIKELEAVPAAQRDFVLLLELKRQRSQYQK